MHTPPEIIVPESYLKIFATTDFIFVPLAVAISFLILRLLQERLTLHLSNGVFHYYFGFTIRTLVCGWALYLFQEQFKAGDVFHYQKAAKVLSAIALENPRKFFELFIGFNEIRESELIERLEIPTAKAFIESKPTGIIVRLASVCMLMLGGSTFAVSIVFCLMSYLGIWLLYRHFSLKYAHQDTLLKSALLYFPSFIFWPSVGISKEAIVFGMLPIVVVVFLKRCGRMKLKLAEIIGFIIAVITIAFVKIYIWISLLAAWIVWKVYRIFTDRIKLSVTQKIIQSLTVVSMGGLFIFANYYYIEIISTPENEQVVRTINSALEYNKNLAGNSTYAIEPLNTDWIHNLKVLAQSLFISLYRPFVWEANNKFSMIYALESLFLMLFSIYLIKGWLERQISIQPEIIFLLFFSMAVLIIVGLTALNFGTLARYRSIPIMYFLLAGLLTLNQKK